MQRLKRLGLYLLGQNCLHLTFEQCLSSETYSRKYETPPNIVIVECKNITEKMHLLKMSGPQIWLCLFYVSTHCVETVKWLDYNRYCQLTRSCSGNASALGARGPGFDPRICQGFFYVSFFALLLLCFYFFVKKNTLFVTKVCNSFYSVIFLVNLTYCKICDRL